MSCPAEEIGRDAVLREPGRVAALERLCLFATPPEPAYDRLTALASRLLRAPIALVNLIGAEQQYFKSSVGLGELRQLPVATGVCSHALHGGKTLVISDATMDPRFRNNRIVTEYGLVSYVGQPLITADGHALGTFCVVDGEPRIWSRDEIGILEDLAQAVVAQLELRRITMDLQDACRERDVLLTSLRELASTDELTGLANRRQLLSRLGQEIARSRRYRCPLSIALVDIDHFKSFNDHHGHRVGDRVLRQVAAVLQESGRTTDFVGRYGGDEFVLVLPEAGQDEALQSCRRLRMALAEGHFEAGGEGLRVTCSFGVAELAAGDTIDELIARADTRLYEGKRGGRDMVVAG